MTRTSLDGTQWASLMLVVQQIPRAREIPQELSHGSATKARFAVSSRPHFGSAGQARRGVTCRTRWDVGPAPATAGGAGACAAGGGWCSRPCTQACPRTRGNASRLPLGWCSWTAPPAKRAARRAASGAARSTAAAEALGRSRGGLCSRPHVCADGAGRIFRLIASPGQHSDLRHAAALASGIPACDAAFGRGYVSAKLRAAFAADGRTIHTPPKKGMVDPPAWTPALCARRHHVEDLFSRMKDWARIALRRDKTRQSRMGFAHLAAIMINSRAAEFSHRA